VPTYAIGIEYHGTIFHGWQRQADQNTVQGDLEKALSQVADSEVLLSAAGRTDAGVHSMGQVASFHSDSDRGLDQWLRGANSLTPQSINITWIVEVEDTFHARFSATARRYLYLFMDRKKDAHASDLAWMVESLDADLMHWHAQNLLGEHDFTSFRGSGCQADSPNRRINRCLVKRIGDLIVLDIEANAFLLHMVRNIASCLSQITKDMPGDHLLEILRCKDRAKIGITGPASGLYLYKVEYPGYSFPLPRLPALLAATSRDFF
jgi:tRNA pseudouridine38-40 synthase